jgi:hypothetical protein
VEVSRAVLINGEQTFVMIGEILMKEEEVRSSLTGDEKDDSTILLGDSATVVGGGGGCMEMSLVSVV